MQIFVVGQESKIGVKPVRLCSFIVAQKYIFSRCTPTQRSAVAAYASTVTLITVAIILSINNLLGYGESFLVMGGTHWVLALIGCINYFSGTVADWHLWPLLCHLSNSAWTLRHAARPSSRYGKYMYIHLRTVGERCKTDMDALSLNRSCAS